jgi:hypothetical protein
MNSFVPDAFDHKGDPADRTKTGGWTSAAQILGKFQCLKASLVALQRALYLNM